MSYILIDTSHKIAQRYIAKLEGSRILWEEADTSRNCIFCIDEILQAFEKNASRMTAIKYLVRHLYVQNRPYPQFFSALLNN